MDQHGHGNGAGGEIIGDGGMQRDQPIGAAMHIPDRVNPLAERKGGRRKNARR